MKTQIKTIIKVALLVQAFILLTACNNRRNNNNAAVVNQSCIFTQTGQPADPLFCQQGQIGYSYNNGLNGFNQWGNQWGQQQFGQYQRIQCFGPMLIAVGQAWQQVQCQQNYNCSGQYAWVNGQYAICN